LPVSLPVVAEPAAVSPEPLPLVEPVVEPVPALPEPPYASVPVEPEVDPLPALPDP
jgi:hypothetical protein